MDSSAPWIDRALERQAGLTETPEQYVARMIQSGPEGIATLRAQFAAMRARLSFSEFCRQAWHVVEPATRLTWGWHHELLCNTLQALFETWFEASKDANKFTPIKNCVVNCPPGSLKSKLIAVFFPVWVWLRAPGVKLICLSVNEDAAHRDARASRDLIKSRWFQDTFGPSWQLKGDQDAISNYGNDAGGERLSKPSGSEIVGLRGDILIGDDLNNPLKSADEAEREKVNSLWDTNQYNRVNDGLRSLRICVQQRTNAGDHTGHVLKKQGHWSEKNPDGWLNVVLPAEFEPSRRYVMPAVLHEALNRALPDPKLVLEDPRRELGQSIDPVRMPTSYLAAERKRWEGTGHYAGQMQQRPALLEGGAIKREWFRFCRLTGGVREEFDELGADGTKEGKHVRPEHCTDAPAYVVKAAVHRPGYWDFDWIVISIDAAAKKTERGSNWGILVIAGQGGRRFVLDDKTQRGDILEILDVLRALIRKWHPDRILIEDKAAGPQLITMLKEEVAKGDLPVVVVDTVQPGTQGKEERLDSCKPTLAANLVHLLDGADWLEDFVEELSLFPNGEQSDRVDALTQVLNEIRENDDPTLALPDW